MYDVTEVVTAQGHKAGVSKEKIALDQGTYYIVLQTDKYSAITSGTTTTITSVKGIAELIVYYQDIKCQETYRPSNVGKENKVTINKEFVGLLTVTNPKDYYKFELKNKALVKFNYMYGSAKNAKFILYSAEREELLTQTFTGNSVWLNVEKYLEPGQYYCSFETVNQNDGGQTNLLINQTIYPLKLKQKNTTKNSYITVKTIDEPKEIRYVKGKLTNSELTSSKWNNGKVITNELLFGVNKTGYYTVRVTDEYGNMFMQSIKVKKCDKKAPSKPTVKKYKAGTYVVSGKAEKKSVVTVTHWGRTYTCTTNSKGVYKCTLPSILAKGNQLIITTQDISGNVSKKVKVTVK